MSNTSDATVLRIVDLHEPLCFTRNQHLVHNGDDDDDDDSIENTEKRATNHRKHQRIDMQETQVRNNAEEKEVIVAWEEIEPAAVRFEAINIDNHLVERHPKIALNVIELRVALAMSFLEFREINDRM